MIETLIKAGQSLLTVLLVGIVLGAGLPALYALGMKALMIGRTVSADGREPVGDASVAGRILAVVCFALVIAFILLGILVVIFPKLLGGH